MKNAAFVLGLFGTAVLFGACVGDDPDPEVSYGFDSGSSDFDSATAPGADGATVTVPPPLGCDATADSKDATGCVVDEFALFVDSAGSDSNAGTKAAPLKTIGAALTKLGGKPRVYICEGTYAEHVTSSGAASLLGGFACGTWTYSGKLPIIAPTDAGPALTIAGATSANIVSDLEVVGPAGTTAAPSSIAMFVASSSDVALRRVTARAATGAAGADGTPGATITLMSTSTGAGDLNLTGTKPVGQTGGVIKKCTCSNATTSTGGAGGNVAGATPGGGGLPAYGGGGAGGIVGSCGGVGAGGKGADAPAIDDATPPALGVIDAMGWHPGDGAAGLDGKPGQGGGGGGPFTSPTAITNGGAGGGCGGCGGGAGGGGKAGGASIALLSFQSKIAIIASTLASDVAGKGGAGQAGSSAELGGLGGTTGSTGCPGGAGGNGSTGSSGAGGAGGISAAVVYTGTEPSADGLSMLTPGAPGAGGLGGAPNGKNPGPMGTTGPKLSF